MKKKQLANLIMVAIILLVMAAGVLGVGYIQGWFDTDDGTYAVVNEIRGIANIQREGVSYPAEKGTVLRNGDRIDCNPGATVFVTTAEGNMAFSNSAQFEVQDATAEHFVTEMYTGEVFINTESFTKLIFEGNTVEMNDAVAMLSVRSGAQTVSVFSGSVEEAMPGCILSWVNGERKIGQLAIQSLNDFAIAQLRKANGSAVTCFADAELDKLEADRWEEKQEQLQGTVPPATTVPPTVTTTPPTTALLNTPPSQTATLPTTTTSPIAAPPPVVTTPPAITEVPIATTTPPAPTYDGYCTITIRCDTILNNWGDLDPAKAGYVPESGVILPTLSVGFYDGETVFDVLNRVCSTYGIQIEYSWTPMYNSYYIEGINHLYEYDCGPESGWMYKVNGWFPNFGCSSYQLQGDETIVWCYTCRGLGKDVGAPGWDS